MGDIPFEGKSIRTLPLLLFFTYECLVHDTILFMFYGRCRIFAKF
jgi:hypothetical protein